MRTGIARLNRMIVPFVLCCFAPGIGAAATSPTPILGAGFTGRPFVLRDDVIIETSGLYEAIRNYGDARTPVWLGWHEHDDTGYWGQLLVEGDLVVALRDDSLPGTPGGFDVADLGNPAAAVVLGRVDGAGIDSGWLHDRAATLNLGSYLMTYDLTDPAEPVYAAFLPVSAHAGPRWFSAVGDVLYVIDHDTAVRAFDVTDALHPLDLGVADLSGFALTDGRIDAMVAGAGVLHVLMADVDGDRLELVTYDLSHPLAPAETSRLPLITGAGVRGQALVRAEKLLLAATSDGRIRAFGLADAARPVAGWSLSHDSDHLVVSRRQIFVTAGDDVFIYRRTTFDVQPGDPVHRSILPRLLTILGAGPVQIAQLYDAPNILRSIDASNPAHPRLGPAFDTGLPGKLHRNGDLGLMTGDGGRAQLIDLADPLRPARLGSLDLPDRWVLGAAPAPSALVLETAPLDAGPVDLRFYDLDDPLSPHLVSTLDAVAAAKPQGWCDNVLVAQRGDELRTYDVTDLTRPEWTGTLELSASILEIIVRAPHAFVLTNDLAITVVDLSDSAAPRIAGAAPPGSALGRLTVHADRLYSQNFNLVRIFDITDPATPVQVAEFPSFVGAAAGDGLAVNGTVVTTSGFLVTVRDDALMLKPPPGETPHTAAWLRSLYPNPFNAGIEIGFTVAYTTELALAIYDLRGRRITELERGTYAPGPHGVFWRGDGADGSPVASGVYLVRLKGPESGSTGRLTLVR